ncbi:MAG TPA: hypothetical protein VKN64_05105 [Halanaerobiales bacterium]|nr:hypothetical protein [Halanaerobiales bacterium]
MKRNWLVVLVVAFVLMFSVGVLAQENPAGTGDGIWTSSEYWEEYDYGTEYNRTGDDGIIWSNLVDPQNPNSDFVNLVGLDRSGYTTDVNRARGDNELDNDQKLEINLPVFAYIPCYLEITLTGNEGKSSLQSFGPDATATRSTLSGVTGPPPGYLGYQLLFDNEIGGFIDADWKSLGAGKNAEIEPGSDIYIAGCDIFVVEVYGNEAFTYEVQSSPLMGMGGATLNMDIRTSMNLGDSWPYEATFDSVDEVAFDKDYDAGNGGTFLHNFRVPYTRNSVHGSYEGDVIFRVVSR